MYKNIFKRIFDFFFSLVLLIVLSPLIIILTVLLCLQNSGKPFFLQNRPGKGEKGFMIIKFRSMTDERDANGMLYPDNERLTPMGKFIRKFSLDELPQLINILKGDMSLVGPRPLLFKYIPLYSNEQRKRHLVRPGITGWAQVNGRNSIKWGDKLRHDIYYVENLSFKLDIKILFMTLFKVVKREGINQTKSRPMQPFNGNN